MQEFLNKVIDICVSAGGKIILALLIFIIGKIIISKILKIVQKTKGFEKLDPSVKSFALSAVKVILYIVLVVSIIGVLGVPMASVITVIASAGVAVGLALQGALGNLAGGIMVLIFRPFNVGDFISAAGEEGIVKEITLFYTVLTSLDNKKITIPNGSLMNANVTNFSSEPQRRVDLVFACAKSADISLVQNTMLDVMAKNEKVLKDPAPFARISGGTNEAMEFTVRAWADNANYWDVYFDLTRDIVTALGAAGVEAPAARVIVENK